MSKYTGVLPLDRRPYRTPTADPDLLPLQLLEAFSAALEANDKDEVRLLVDAYARACIAHATAAKDAEIEALRAQLDEQCRQITRAPD